MCGAPAYHHAPTRTESMRRESCPSRSAVTVRAVNAPPIPRSAVWLARAHLLLALVGLAAGGAAAMVLRAELWSPERGGSLEGYGNWLGVHGGSLLFVA